MRTFQRLAPLLPGAALLGVFLTQLVLVHTSHLSAWKGGGFGMFAVTDTRFISCSGHSTHGEPFICWIPEQASAIREPANALLLQTTLNLPTESNLRRLAGILLNGRFLRRSAAEADYVPADQELFEWSPREDGRFAVRLMDADAPARIEAAEITLRVWRRRYDPATGILSPELLASGSFRP